jgi:hypothetical protein
MSLTATAAVAIKDAWAGCNIAWHVELVEATASKYGFGKAVMTANAVHLTLQGVVIVILACCASSTEISEEEEEVICGVVEVGGRLHVWFYHIPITLLKYCHPYLHGVFIVELLNKFWCTYLIS